MQGVKKVTSGQEPWVTPSVQNTLFQCQTGGTNIQRQIQYVCVHTSLLYKNDLILLNITSISYLQIAFSMLSLFSSVKLDSLMDNTYVLLIPTFVHMTMTPSSIVDPKISHNFVSCWTK